MTLFQIVALYVALHLLLNIILMYRVGQVRIKEKIALGDGGNTKMIASMRAHANFSETAPLAVIGLIALAMMSAHPYALHLFGAVFFLGLLLHAPGRAAADGNGKGRLYGTMMTLFTYVGTAGYLLWLIFTFTTG